jgi:hypothetical protein
LPGTRVLGHRKSVASTETATETETLVNNHTHGTKCYPVLLKLPGWAMLRCQLGTSPPRLPRVARSLDSGHRRAGSLVCCNLMPPSIIDQTWPT